jgi:hypothetical protein
VNVTKVAADASSISINKLAIEDDVNGIFHTNANANTVIYSETVTTDIATVNENLVTNSKQPILNPTFK